MFKSPISHRHLLFSLILIGVALIPQTGVYAQLGIISVQPNRVTGQTAVELVVTGTDFVDGAVVVVENFGALTTSFVSSTVLTAVLPAGIAPGVYTITVINPDSTSASLPGALTVLEPTATAAPPTSPPTGVRPLLVVESYSAGGETITPGKSYTLIVKLHNAGDQFAKNILVVFPPGDFVPQKTGGVQAVAELGPDETQRLSQPVNASYDLLGKSFATVVMQVSYTDPNGVSYSETFNLALPVTPPRPGAFNTATPTPTMTPVPIARPQLVINSYGTDVEILQPGVQFELSLELQNKGNADARLVSMVLGGGSSSPGAQPGTPQPGGVSGGSADLGNFAPVAASNVKFLGDLKVGQEMQTAASLIVNANTNPGAYPLKISFTYSDDKGNYYTDDQVVTLLVYSLPQVDVNYYRPPDPLFAGQPGVLPIQVVNIGRKSAVLGTMKVTAEGVELSNNEVLVGPLDIGGYYTLDVTAIPMQAGPLELLITITYSDDFSQARMLTDTLLIEVQEATPIEPLPGEGGFEPQPEPQPETFWQKVWRFVRGLLGLDSSVPQPQPLPGEMPPEQFPGEQPVPVPVQGPKG